MLFEEGVVREELRTGNDKLPVKSLVCLRHAGHQLPGVVDDLGQMFPVTPDDLVTLTVLEEPRDDLQYWTTHRASVHVTIQFHLCCHLT